MVMGLYLAGILTLIAGVGFGLAMLFNPEDLFGNGLPLLPGITLLVSGVFGSLPWFALGMMLDKMEVLLSFARGARASAPK